MKKTFFTSQKFTAVLLVLFASFYIISCQKEDIATDVEDATQSETIQQKIGYIPYEPDFSPPNVPNPPSIDEHCVVRLAYLSYLERCPENASVVGYWINILRAQQFGGLAVGFITSPEASHRWNSRYHSYLQRNNVSSSQISKRVYIAYRGLLLREPDVNGGLYWTNIERTRGILSVANGIGNSPEFQNRLSRISTECANAASRCTF